jgi:hypothetical protein
MPWIFLFIALALLSLIVVFFGMRRRRASLTPSVRSQIKSQLEHMRGMEHSSLQILEAEKILDGVFSHLGATGSFADKLRSMESRIPNKESVWQAHKLRNRLAHEAGMHVSDHEAGRAIKTFERAIHTFL